MDSDISLRNINRYSTSTSVGCPSGLWTSFISAIFSFRYRRARVPSRSTPCLPVIHNWLSCGDGESDDDRQRKRPGVLLAISLTPSHHGYESQKCRRLQGTGGGYGSCFLPTQLCPQRLDSVRGPPVDLRLALQWRKPLFASAASSLLSDAPPLHSPSRYRLRAQRLKRLMR